MDKVKFCVKDGCYEPAIGVSRWNPDEKPVSDYCRPHYLSDALTETVRAEVVGPHLITDCRTQQGVAKGGVVELDPRETNVAQLVYAGHVKVVTGEPGPEKVTKPVKPAEAKKD